MSNRRPDASTTLLALSDLGALDRDPERLALWRRIRSEAKRTSARTCALVVLDDERRAPDARAGWTVRPWARSVRRASVVAPAEALSALEELFLLLSPAAWVDFPLLRAMRQRVRAPGAGASLEAGAWLDPRVNRLADERGFVLRPDVLLELRAEFRGLPPSRRAEVAELLDAMHGHLGVVARAEELFALGDERAAGQARALIATYACLVRDRAGVDDSVEKAYLGRFETLVPKEQWQHDEPKALWALHHAAGDCFDRHPPEGLDLESIRWALERLPEPTSCRIWQRGTELEFVLAAAEERGPLSETGCTLCELPLRFRTLAVLQRFGNDRVQRATLALESTPAEHVRVPASPSESLVLGSDLARLEMRLEPRPPWATAWYRDEHGLWFETTVKGFWLTSVAQASASFSVRRRVSSRGARPKPPPVWQLEERSVPMQLAYPTWAIRLDQDDHGLFAELELASGVVMRLRWIPPGSFVMGSPEDEQGRWEDEGSKHRVELTRGYWLADAPCTQAQWEAVMENNPSRFRQDVDCPVEQVSWEDCQAFCGQLKERFPGVDARLPSEAEWEFACRAGKQSAYNDGSACSEPEGADPALLKLGWFKANSEGKTHGVRGKLPNAWGLYDMHGNVMEWCADWWQGDYRSAGEVDPQGPPRGGGRVIRGGGWGGPARVCRSACRGSWLPTGRYDYLGFRLAAGQVSQTVSRQAEQGSGASGRPRSDEGRGV